MNLKLKKYIENGNYELALKLINQILKKENTYENLALRGIVYLYLKSDNHSSHLLTSMCHRTLINND